MLSKDILTHLYTLASNSPTREICGVLTEDLQLMPVANVAKDNQQFIMDKREFFKILNKLREENRRVLAIYHSHPNNDPTPSQADIDSSRRTGYNYLIVTTNQYKWVDI